MYKPLGLGCGHKFCTECVLSVVQVEGQDLLKPLRRILADVPHGTACPQCRQRAVFYNAVELKKLGAFIYATCGPFHCLLRLLILGAARTEWPLLHLQSCLLGGRELLVSQVLLFCCRAMCRGVACQTLAPECAPEMHVELVVTLQVPGGYRGARGRVRAETRRAEEGEDCEGTCGAQVALRPVLPALRIRPLIAGTVTVSITALIISSELRTPDSVAPAASLTSSRSCMSPVQQARRVAWLPWLYCSE